MTERNSVVALRCIAVSTISLGVRSFVGVEDRGSEDEAGRIAFFGILDSIGKNERNLLDKHMFGLWSPFRWHDFGSVRPGEMSRATDYCVMLGQTRCSTLQTHVLRSWYSGVDVNMMTSCSLQRWSSALYRACHLPHVPGVFDAGEAGDMSRE